MSGVGGAATFSAGHLRHRSESHYLATAAAAFANAAGTLEWDQSRGDLLEVEWGGDPAAPHVTAARFRPGDGGPVVPLPLPQTDD